tara:strand:- start:28 stop:201 length:174 start_codon:yes stop_codon:yes gene_type:complete
MADEEDVEGISYLIRKGYAVIIDEQKFNEGYWLLSESIQQWEFMNEDDKKKYGFYDE